MNDMEYANVVNSWSVRLSRHSATNDSDCIFMRTDMTCRSVPESQADRLVVTEDSGYFIFGHGLLQAISGKA